MDNTLQQELKRISRKARRFAARHKFSKKSEFRIDLKNHPGVSLISSPVMAIFK